MPEPNRVPCKAAIDASSRRCGLSERSEKQVIHLFVTKARFITVWRDYPVWVGLQFHCRELGFKLLQGSLKPPGAVSWPPQGWR